MTAGDDPCVWLLPLKPVSEVLSASPMLSTLSHACGFIDYIIVHELARLAQRGHDRASRVTVERAMPDYERRKGASGAACGAYGAACCVTDSGEAGRARPWLICNVVA